MTEKTAEPTYPKHVWTAADQILAYFAAGYVCAVDETWESGMRVKYAAPPNLVHFAHKGTYPYIYGWSADGECYALTHSEWISQPKRDFHSLEAVLAELEEREAEKTRQLLEAAKAEREKRARMIEAKRRELELAEQEAKEAAARVQEVSGTYGAAQKSAKAARAHADEVSKHKAAS